MNEQHKGLLLTVNVAFCFFGLFGFGLVWFDFFLSSSFFFFFFFFFLLLFFFFFSSRNTAENLRLCCMLEIKQYNTT